MKRITPERNLFGDVTGYTVSDVDPREIEINGKVAEAYMKITAVFFALIFLPPLFIMASPILYFVSRNMLKKESEFKNRKLLVVVNKITLVILIYWIVCLSLILIFGTVYFLYRFGVIEIPLLDQILEMFGNA